MNWYDVYKDLLSSTSSKREVKNSKEYICADCPRNIECRKLGIKPLREEEVKYTEGRKLGLKPE